MTHATIAVYDAPLVAAAQAGVDRYLLR